MVGWVTLLFSAFLSVFFRVRGSSELLTAPPPPPRLYHRAGYVAMVFCFLKPKPRWVWSWEGIAIGTDPGKAFGLRVQELLNAKLTEINRNCLLVPEGFEPFVTFWLLRSV